jgi:hypothetical protein
MQKFLPLLAFLLASICCTATDTLFTDKNLPEKFKVQKTWLHLDSATGHVFTMAVTSNRVMLNRIDKQMAAVGKGNWSISEREESTAPAGPVAGFLPLDDIAGAWIQNQTSVMRQVRGDSLVEYYVDETSAEVFEVFYNVKSGEAGYHKLVKLEKGEFPYAINMKGHRLFYITSYKKSSNMRVQIFENGGLQKEHRFTVNLEPYYSQGWMNKDDDETLSKLLPNLMMGDVKAASLFLVRDAGSYQPFSALSGNSFLTQIADTLKLYASTKKGVLFCFALHPETGQWTITRVFGEPHFTQLRQQLPNMIWPENCTNVNEYEQLFPMKTIAETHQYLIIARVQKPQLHLIYLDKNSGGIAKVEHFDADKETTPEANRIYSALDLAKRPASSNISAKKFTTVAVATLGLAGINAIELPNKKLLLALMVKDERINMGDVVGALAGSVLLGVLPGGSSLASAFAEGAAAGFAGTLIEEGISALSDQKVYMYAQVYNGANLQPIADTLPLVPELEQSMAEITRVNNILRSEMVSPSYMREQQMMWLCWYNKKENTINVLRKEM